MTGRDEQPIIESLARAKMWAATAVERPEPYPAPGGTDLCESRCGVLAAL